MSEDNKLTPETPADVLHAHVQNHIQLPETQKFDNESLIDEVTAHPNLQAQSIADMYKHATEHHAQGLSTATGEAELGHLSNTSAENLLTHPNTPKDIKTDFIGKTYHPSNPLSDLHQKLADEGHVPDQQLRNMSEAVLGMGENPYAYKQIAPDYYLNHFKARSQQDPEGFSAEENESHRRESQFAKEGLFNSVKHTPESLDQTIQAIADNKHVMHLYSSGPEANVRMFEKLVQSREDLSKDQLNRIHQYAEANEGGDTIEEVLKHKNADPALLAKYATGQDIKTEALSHANLPKESINAFIKKVKNPNGWDEKSDIEALLENPSITKEHVKSLIKKGSTAALHHELADESDVRDSYNKSDKGLGASRFVLGAKKVPPDVLKELVNHKNQDVAVQALKHPNADIDVVNEGLKRKAKGVQDEARLHPLVAAQQASEGLKSGKVSLTKAYTDPDYQKHFDQMTPADQEKVFSVSHDKYKGGDIEDIAKKSKEKTPHVIYNKYKLASDPRVPEEIREQHGRELSEIFTDKIPRNSAIDEKNVKILSDDHKSDNGRIIRAVSSLAQSGNADAQKALLNNPAALQGIKNHLNLEESPGSFLEAMYRKGNEYQRNGTTVYDYRGNPESFDKSATLLDPLFSSKNLPEETFHEIASNKDMMEKLGEGDWFKRYNTLPVDEQNAKYSSILASGSSEAAKSVLKAQSPPESWNEAFGMLGPQDKAQFIHSNIQHVKSHRPDIFTKAALGIYSEPGIQSSPVQLRAIANLSNSLEDHQTMRQIISTPEEQVGGLSDEDIQGTIPPHVEAKDFNLADHAFKSDRLNLGYHLVGKKIESDVAKLKGVRSYDSAREQQEAKDEIAGKLAEINQKIETMPTIVSEDNPNAAKWNSLIGRSETNTYSRGYFSLLKEKGANLDFLADMPGKDGDTLKKTALSHNLISNEKILQLAQSGTVEDILNIRGSNKIPAISALIQKPDIKPEELEMLAEKMNHSFINPDAHTTGRRVSMSESAYDHYSKTLNQMIDLYAEKAPNSLGTLVKNAFKARHRDEELTQKDKDAIQNNISKHVYNKQYSSEQAKNQSLYQLYKGLKANNVDPRSLKQALEKNVMKSGDIDTMIQMAQSSDLSSKNMVAFSKLATKPDILTTKQLSSLSSVLSHNSEPETIMGFAKAFETKVAQEPNVDYTEQKNTFLKNITTTFTSRNIDEDHKQKNDFVINYNKKAALDPQTAPVANSNLLNISTQIANTDLNKSLDIYTSLPDDATKFDSKNDFYTAVPKDMLNHPRFMESSHSGWKLQKLASSASNLTGTNASILTSRVLSGAGGEINKTFVMTHFENNPFVQSEDSIKLARSMSENDFNTLIKNTASYSVGNSLNGNIVFAAHARLTDLENIVKDPNLANPGAPFMGDEHRNKIAYNLHALSHVINAAEFDESAPLVKDKLGHISDMISKIHEHSMHLATSMISDIKKTGYTTEIGRDANFLLSTAQNIADTGISLDRGDSLKVIEMANMHRKIGELAETKGKAESYKVIGKVVEKAENLEEQDWKQTFTSEPHAVFNLSKRQTIPSEALRSIDFSTYENYVPAKEEPYGRTTQDIFAKESSSWFPKVSKEDLNHHGKNLMGMYVRLVEAGKISQATYKNAMGEALKYTSSILEHKDVMNLVHTTKDQDVKNSIFRDAVTSGAGGENTLKQYAKDFGPQIFKDVKESSRYEQDQVASDLEPILKSPHINDEIGSNVLKMFKQNPEVMQKSTIMMLSNKSTPSKTVGEIADYLMQNHKNGYKDLDNKQSADIAMVLMQHPNMEESALVDMFNISNEKYPKFFESKGKFNPALTNPTHGGKLFRSMPITVPSDVPGVEASSVVRDVSLQHKTYQRMQDVMNLIPPEGISWADFKRKHPAEEKTLPQEVKSVFMSVNNKLVMPEDFAKGLRSLDDASKKYHLTYSHWTSKLQKHRTESQSNLVVQVNNSKESEAALSQDPKLWSLYQKLLTQANGIDGNTIGLHPTTPQLVSWSRVDTDQGGEAWVIEEHQSDFAQKFRKNLKSILKEFPAGAKINGHHITVEEMSNYAKQIDKHLNDWSEASIQAVIDNAKAHGIKKLFMHGPELRSHMSGSSRGVEYNRESWDNKNTRSQMSGFRKIYEETPIKHGFKECDYTDYPKDSTRTLTAVKSKGLSTKCWLLDLGQESKPKKRKKPNLPK